MKYKVGSIILQSLSDTGSSVTYDGNRMNFSRGLAKSAVGEAPNLTRRKKVTRKFEEI